MSIIANRQFMIVGATSPTLVNGAFSITFPAFAKILHAGVVHWATIRTADYVYMCKVESIVGNVVTVHIYKAILTGAAGTGTWGDAITADVAACTIEVLAEGL